MIEARLRKARRLLDLHRDLKRIEEQRVAGLRSRQAELAALQEETAASLNSDEGLRSLFLPVIVRRLQALGEESQGVAEELERRSRALRTLAGRTKFAERLSRTIEQEMAKALAQKELLEAIERITGPATQASHKPLE
jgi:hypothetical protein